MKRFYSSNTIKNISHIKNETERLFHNFKRVAPCFPHNGQSKLINSPSDFYQTILKGIETSEKRIILSSLYLGAGEQSKLIVFIYFLFFKI